jgi:hypothetical protein
MSASKMLRQGAITDQNGSIAKTFFSSPAGHAPPSNMGLHARVAPLRECRAGRAAPVEGQRSGWLEPTSEISRGIAVFEFE